MNFRLLLQYDGTDFHGWQTQTELRTVQGELTRVLSLLDGREVVVHGSGRTDAGVRAAINGNLPDDVRVLFTDIAPEDFHARYSARSKTYVYRVVSGQVMSPFWSRYALADARALDLEQMRSCASSFLGEHDWTAFSAAQTEAGSRVRTISSLEIDSRSEEHSSELQSR